MKHWSHHITEKYTIALIDLFNDLNIEYIKSDGSKTYTTIPLKFRSRERAINLSEQETQEILNGNTSIVPRASLSLLSIEKSLERTTNKYINSHDIKTPDGKKYTLNSVAYDWNFSLTLLTRTLTESTQIIEQIAPIFRPSYTLNINEIDISQEPTTIILDLLDINLDVDNEHDDDTIRTIITEFNFTLRGNMYLPIKEQSLIEHMKIYIGNWFLEDNEYEKSVLIQQKGDIDTRVIQDRTTDDLRPVINQKDSSMVPVVQDIIMYKDKNAPLETTVGSIIELHGLVQDVDNEPNEITYVWTCTSGVITSNSHVVQYRAIESGVFSITLTVVDYHRNQSLSFSKNITVN